mmetsp:Transcript_25900/g.72270  ORF Transcript_25900/g.72270 Transcript_25900/m.72270 type:complete len:680 (-) Transcript_25900:14-2053(-)
MGVCCSDRGRVGYNRHHAATTCSRSFRQPVHPLGSATAGTRFFRLVPADAKTEAEDQRSGPCEQPPEQPPAAKNEALFPALCAAPPYGEVWIGKDLSQAFDELEFYDEALQLRGEDGWDVFDYLADYHGVLWNTCCVSADLRVRSTDMLVFRSPMEGLARPRLLNLEVGPRTSALQLSRCTLYDYATTARQESIRIEGFLAPPNYIASEEPSCDSKGWAWGEASQPRAQRAELQKLMVADAIAAFADLREAVSEERLWPGAERCTTPKTCGDAFSEHFLGPSEYSELVVHSLISEVVSLLRACARVPTPQKWLGTSVCLIIDVGAAPPRRNPEISMDDWVAARVKLRIAGWGRSMVSCPTRPSFKDVLQDNDVLWVIYQESVGWILWEAARFYFHSFCVQKWHELQFEVYAQKRKGVDQLVGRATFRLAEHSGNVQRFFLPLMRGGPSGAQLHGDDGMPSQIVITLSFATFPKPSRLNGAWHVWVMECLNLPPPATRGKSQGLYVRTVAEGQPSGGCGAGFHVAHRTRSVPYASGPSWKDQFEFPVAINPSVGHGASVGCLLDVLGCQNGDSDLEKWSALLPPPALASAPDDACPDAQNPAAREQVEFLKAIRTGWASGGFERLKAKAATVAAPLVQGPAPTPPPASDAETPPESEAPEGNVGNAGHCEPGSGQRHLVK